jgi:hypothetical protein
MAKSKYPQWRLPLLRRSYFPKLRPFSGTVGNRLSSRLHWRQVLITWETRKEGHFHVQGGRRALLLLLLHVSIVGGEKQPAADGAICLKSLIKSNQNQII